MRKTVVFRSTGRSTMSATTSTQNELNSRAVTLGRAPLVELPMRKFGRKIPLRLWNRTQVMTVVRSSSMRLVTVASMFAVRWLRVLTW